MTLVEQQELIRAARERLDEERSFLQSEMLKGRMTEHLSDRFAGMRRTVAELRELKQ